jgi:hypothetical protein
VDGANFSVDIHSFFVDPAIFSVDIHSFSVDGTIKKWQKNKKKGIIGRNSKVGIFTE